MAQLPSPLISHTKKVLSLYKRSLRALEALHETRESYRYHAVLLRDRFDKNKNINDLRVAKMLLIEGEEELFEKDKAVVKAFPDSPIGGISYRRYFTPPDWVLDYWHPVEREQFPKYFARREQRKKEYEELYYKQNPDMKQPKH